MVQMLEPENKRFQPSHPHAKPPTPPPKKKKKNKNKKHPHPHPQKMAGKLSLKTNVHL